MSVATRLPATRRRPVRRRSPDRSVRVSPAGRALVIALVLGVSVVFGMLAAELDSMLLPAAALMIAAVVLAVQAPRAVLLTTLLGLPFIGLLRRATGSYTLRVDPLALAGPGLAILCVLILSFRNPPSRRSPLTVAVSAMVALGVLQALNPAQGSLLAGVLGAGLFVGPLVWYYAGQRIGDPATLAFVVRALKVVVAVAAAYGVKQIIFGFTGFEEAWIATHRASYAALEIAGNTRPFSTFASGVEYSYFLALGAVLLAIGAGRERRVTRSFAVAGLLLACFYAGSRTVVVTAVLSVVIVVLVQQTRSLGRAIVLCGALGLLCLGLLRLVPLATEQGAAGAIQNRTLTGLVHPFDRNASTLGLHLDSFGRGVVAGLRTPLGRGAASVNLAGSKLGHQVVSAEHDVPNVLLAYGWAGGIILAVLVLNVYRVLGSSVRNRRRHLLGPGVFVLFTFGVWFSGELYAASALIWFFLGSIDRLNSGADVSAAGGGASGALPIGAVVLPA